MPCLQAAFLLHCYRAVPQPQGKRQYSPTPQLLAVPQDRCKGQMRCQQRPAEATVSLAGALLQPCAALVQPLDSLEEPVPGSIHLGGARMLETKKKWESNIVALV